MSDPKRWMLEWDENNDCSCGQVEHPNGDFVYYSAYAETKAAQRAASLRCISYVGQLGEQSAEIAHLKAEVERLTNCKAEADRLKAEVERLREAGDAMAEIIEGTYCIDKPPALIDWNAATEGKAGDALGDSIQIYRLKAEVDLWKLRSDNWQKLVQLTKAEVERLTDAITRGAIIPDAKPE